MILRRSKAFMDLLQREGNEVNFGQLCEALRQGFDNTSVYLVSRRGKLLGYSLETGFEKTPFDQDWLHLGVMPDTQNSNLLKVGALTQTTAETGETMMVVPVIGANKRVGTLLFVTDQPSFTEEDTIIGEFSATAIGMVISHALDEEEEDEAQESKLARSAINSLSYSEIIAMQRIFDELDGDEGLLVASRIADEAGITRSVIVNALRKLASANVIESRSLGMKGTYLRVLNKEIRKEFEERRYPYPSNKLG